MQSHSPPGTQVQRMPVTNGKRVALQSTDGLDNTFFTSFVLLLIHLTLEDSTLFGSAFGSALGIMPACTATSLVAGIISEVDALP